MGTFTLKYPVYSQESDSGQYFYNLLVEGLNVQEGLLPQNILPKYEDNCHANDL